MSNLMGLAAVNELLEQRAKQREEAARNAAERARSMTVYLDAPAPTLSDLLKGKVLWKNFQQIAAEDASRREQEELERHRLILAPEIEW